MAPEPKVQLTILNDMASMDFANSLRIQKLWGIKTVDLRGHIFGKNLLDLTDDEACKASSLIKNEGMDVYCLSTGIFGGDIDEGELAFRKKYNNGIQRAIELAAFFKPRFIRLLAARSLKKQDRDGITDIMNKHPWLTPLYVEAIDRIAAAGYTVTIENEVRQCILVKPQDIVQFIDSLNRRPKVHLTWDIQNLWYEGAYPSLEVYEMLRPFIGYVHLKGGQGDNHKRLRWSSSLEDASWPVIEITRQVIHDGVSPVICLNPSHGDKKPGYNYDNIVARDIEFLRKHIPEVQR